MRAEDLIDKYLEQIKEPPKLAGYPGAKDTDLKLSKGFDKLNQGQTVKGDKVNGVGPVDTNRNSSTDTGLVSSGKVPYRGIY